MTFLTVLFWAAIIMVAILVLPAMIAAASWVLLIAAALYLIGFIAGQMKKGAKT